MANKHTRPDLQVKFAAGSIPTFEDFADIFASSLNQLDDEIRKEADQSLMLKIPAESSPGDPREVLLLYEDFTADPLWKVQVRGGGLEIGRNDLPVGDIAIDSQGRVGIGIPTPGAPLEVAMSNGGSIQLGRENFAMIGGNESHTLHIESGQKLNDGTWNTGGIYLNQYSEGKTIINPYGGNVGIGEVNPTEKLEVNGKVKATEFHGRFFQENGDEVTRGETSPWAENGDKLYVSSEQVGIGLADPLDMLHMRFLDQDNYVRIESGSSSGHYAGIKLYEATHDYGWAIRMNAANDWLYFDQGGGEALDTKWVITNQGDVGIGVPIPTEKLEVNGRVKATEFQGKFFNTDGTELTGDGGSSSPWNTSGENISLTTGNVGIGVSRPLAPLHIISPTNNGGHDLAEAETVVRLAREGVSGGSYPNLVDFSLKRYEDERVEARTQLDISLLHGRVYRPGTLNENNPDTLVMSLRSNGNVGIGTSNPGNDKLDVRGRCYSSGGWTSSNADYAELLETNSGKPIPPGTAVVFARSGKIRPAKQGESPCGVVSANPAVVGNSYKEWPEKYVKDDFGAPILEEYQEEIPAETEGGEPSFHTQTRPRLNPAYDPEQPYLRREDRPEWVPVGLVGLLPLRKGQPTAPHWHKIKNLSKTTELWLVK